MIIFKDKKSEDKYFKEKYSQIREWYNLWVKWFAEMDELTEEDGLPPRPDEIYPNMADETIEKFGHLSEFECQVLKNMAHVHILKAWGIE